MPGPLYDKGLSIRKAVVGAELVEKMMSEVDEFNKPFQELLNEYCWGAIWGREGLDRKIRSIINIALLSALNRPHELKLHIQGALRNGCTRDEIREVLMQVAVYCGVPAANEAFRIARDAMPK